MGLHARLQTENGEVLDQVEDPTNALHRVLPPPDDLRYHYVGCIDWYGDTTFNTLQMSRFLDEWARLRATAAEVGAEALHARIEALAKRCQDEVHVYLKFAGD